MPRCSGSAVRSLRRAFDAGWSAADVRRWLEHHATTALPQPLAYLIDDIARQHGSIRVGPANAYVRIADRLRPPLCSPTRTPACWACASSRPGPGRPRGAVRGGGLPAPDRPQPRGRGLVRSVARPLPIRCVPPGEPRIDPARTCRPARRLRRSWSANEAGTDRGPGRRRRTWSRRPGSGGDRRDAGAADAAAAGRSAVRIRYVAADGRPAERELRSVQA